MSNLSDLNLTLKSIPWFHDLPEEKINLLAGSARFCDIAAGEWLFKEGARTDTLYILLDGQLVLESFVPTRGSVCMVQAEPLDIIGWSCVTPVVREQICGAKANSNCHLICFDSASLLTICDADPELGYLVMHRLCNVIASYFLNIRLQLFDIIVHQPAKNIPNTQE